MTYCNPSNVFFFFLYWVILLPGAPILLVDFYPPIVPLAGPPLLIPDLPPPSEVSIFTMDAPPT